MSTYFVTRHPGAIEWLHRHFCRGQSAGEPRMVVHLDDVAFQPGDKVVGVLPLSAAAAICAQGAEVHVLTYDTPLHLRGRELSADELEALGARLVRYEVKVVAPSAAAEEVAPRA